MASMPATEGAATPVPVQRHSAAPSTPDLPAELAAGPTDVFMSVAPFPTPDTAPWVGAVLHVRLGAPVRAGQPLYTIHAESPGELAYARAYAEQHPSLIALDEGDG